MGTHFTISGSIADAFKATFSPNPILLDLLGLGISTPTQLPYNDSGITPGHPPNPKWNGALSWSKTLAVAVSGIRSMDCIVSQLAQDPWGVSGYDFSPSSPIMLDTVSHSSTDTDESFDDERYRLVPQATWPIAPVTPPVGASKLDSQLILNNTSNRGAQVLGGELVYPSINFSTPVGRRPTQQVGVDYSGITGDRNYQRAFRHDVTPDTRSNVVMYLPGLDVTAPNDIDPGGSGELNMFIWIPGASTTWFDCGKQYISALFPAPEPGCLVKALSGVAGGFPTNEYWYFTFGSYSTIPTDRTIILSVVYRAGPLKRLSRVFAYNWT
jgi:hypothetical protein